MADSKAEQVLKAFHFALAAAAPAGVGVYRNLAVPTNIPPGGLIILRDGDPGPPEVLLSPATYIYEHVADVEVIVELDDQLARDALFDQLKQAVGAATSADRTLGGLCDYVLGVAPETTQVPMEGAEAIKAATVGVIFNYDTSDPLA